MSKDKKDKDKTKEDERDGDELRMKPSYDITKIRDYLNDKQLALLDEFRRSTLNYQKIYFTKYSDERRLHIARDPTFLLFALCPLCIHARFFQVVYTSTS